MRIISSSDNDVLLDWDALEEMYSSDTCYLTALSGKQIALIKSLIRYAHWPTRWRNYSNWDDVITSVDEMEYCLMAGCDVSQLITVLEEIRDKIPSPGQTLTLQNIYDNVVTSSPDDDDLYHAYPLLEKIIDFLPDEFVEDYRLSDPAGFAVSLFGQAESLVLQKWSTLFEALQGVGDLIEGVADSGEAVADVAATVIGEVPELISAGALSTSAIVDLLNLFIAISNGGSKSEDPDSDEDLRALLRVYNNIFLTEEAMSITQTQTVNCGGCGGGGLGSNVCFVADESGAQSSLDQPNYTLPDGESGESPPGDWDTWGGEEGYYNYKCKAANAMVLGLAERLYQLGDIANGAYQGPTHAVTARNIEAKLLALDTAWITLGSGSTLPVFTRDVNHPLLVMVRSYTAQLIADYFYPDSNPDAFEIFYNLRLDILEDRELWVCGLYADTSTDEAKTAIMAAIDDYLDTYTSYTEEDLAWARSIVEAKLINAWLNLLFVYDDTINQYDDSTAIECISCSAGHWLACHEVRTTDNPIEDVSSIEGCGNSYGCEAVILLMDHDGVAYLPGNKQYLVTVTNGPSSPCGGGLYPGPYNYYDENHALLHSGAQQTDLPCNEILIIGPNGSDFTCDIALTEYVP